MQLFGCCRDFPDKVIDNLNFLNLLAVNLLDLAHQNSADKPVQNGFVQFLNSGVLSDFLNERSHIAFLFIRPAHHQHQVLQAPDKGYWQRSPATDLKKPVNNRLACDS